MPRADDWARASEMNAHLEWSSADDGDRGSEESPPTARGFFLGQLPDNQPDDEPEDVWADEPDDVWADEPRDDVWAADPPREPA